MIECDAKKLPPPRPGEQPLLYFFNGDIEFHFPASDGGPVPVRSAGSTGMMYLWYSLVTGWNGTFESINPDVGAKLPEDCPGCEAEHSMLRSITVNP